ncbi:MAG: hypothetical protein KDN22_11470 [Verrucomicrobiae bacterium]|nr:hypothetical protein [Verrucomicrobiae bacterium]
MAKLKPSEFRLLLIFCIVAFILVNAYGYKELMARQNALILQKQELTGKLKTADVYQSQEADSRQKEQWLMSRVKVYRSQDEMKTFLLKFVEQRASSFNLVPELQPREPELKDGYMRSILEVKLSGTIDQLLPLVFSLQDPEEFRSITSFDLKAKPKEPTTLFLEFTIEQWWNPDSPEIVANGTAAPTVEMPVGVPAPPTPAGDGDGGGGGGGVLPPGPGTSAAGLPEPLKRSIALPPGATPTPAANTTGDGQLPVLNESGNDDKPQ